MEELGKTLARPLMLLWRFTVLMERMAFYSLVKRSLVHLIRYSLEVIQMFLYFM